MKTRIKVLIGGVTIALVCVIIGTFATAKDSMEHSLFSALITVLLIALVFSIVMLRVLEGADETGAIEEHAKFDEYQKYIQYKYVYHAFFLLQFLVLVSALVSSFYTWAEPLVMGAIIALIPAIYVETMITLNGASTPFNQEKMTKETNGLKFIVASLWLWGSYREYKDFGMEWIIKDGVLQNSFLQLLLALFFIYSGLLYIYGEKIKKN